MSPEGSAVNFYSPCLTDGLFARHRSPSGWDPLYLTGSINAANAPNDSPAAQDVDRRLVVPRHLLRNSMHVPDNLSRRRPRTEQIVWKYVRDKRRQPANTGRCRWCFPSDIEALDTKPVSTNNFVTIDKDAEAKPPELKRRTREWVHPAQNHHVDHLAFVGQWPK